jgi:hypothetical protein
MNAVRDAKESKSIRCSYARINRRASRLKRHVCKYTKLTLTPSTTRKVSSGEYIVNAICAAL